MLADTLSRLTDLELTEASPPEKEGNDYGYALFKPLPEIHFDSGKHSTLPPITITIINTINNNKLQKESVENTEIYLSLSTEMLTDIQNNDTFCVAMLKLINDKVF